MSFTYNIKTELCGYSFPPSEQFAELCAYIRNNVKIYDDYFELTTENMNVAKRIYNSLKNMYGISLNIEELKNASFNRKYLYRIVVRTKKDDILRDLCVVDDAGNRLDNPKDFVFDSEEEKKAYIKGAFLAKGSINDPKTSMYHMEMGFDYKFESVLIQRLLNEYDFNSKILMRDNKYMVYIKEAEKISDFLKLIGASKAVMYYENVRVLHEQKNITNRLNNCEQANIDKIIMTCNNQIADIKLIEEELGLDLLDDKLKEVCEYRMKYPETSLGELSDIISMETNKKITKSGLNHRFRKIREIASRLEKDKN